MISILMCSLNEEDTIEIALESISNQSYAGNYEIILADSGSIDNTLQLASQYCDRILNVPKGKLTARNIGTQYTEGDIIVSVDADSEYHSNWLENLLRPFQNNGVIGVRGRTIHDDPTFAWNRIWTLFEDISMLVVFPNRMPGRNSAYYKDMFYMSGGFDDSINQQVVEIIIQEEEIGFGNRLAQLGKVIYTNNAICYHKHMGEDKMLCRAIAKIPGSRGICKDYGIGTERF